MAEQKEKATKAEIEKARQVLVDDVYQKTRTKLLKELSQAVKEKERIKKDLDAKNNNADADELENATENVEDIDERLTELENDYKKFKAVSSKYNAEDRVKHHDYQSALINLVDWNDDFQDTFEESEYGKQKYEEYRDGKKETIETDYQESVYGRLLYHANQDLYTYDLWDTYDDLKMQSTTVNSFTEAIQKLCNKEEEDKKAAEEAEKIRQENEKAKNEAKEAQNEQVSLLQEPDFTVKPEYYKEYGNNFFRLITYDDFDNIKEYAGVLKDLPTFSMGTSWEKGPASTISDAVKKYMCCPLFEIISTIGNRDRSWMNLDEGTDRVYASTNKPSFSLSFKLYTTENIGSKKLTSWKTWLNALSTFAPPSISTKTDILNIGENTVKGAFDAIPKVQDTLKAAKTAFDSNDGLDALIKAIKEFANEAETQIIKRDGPRRVSSKPNSQNFYGAKLWYLTIFPAFFKNPLIVYISNWGVTYSKEINLKTAEPIWVEFKITCEMDQIASAPVWKRYLR